MSGEKLNYGAEFHSYLEGLSAALATSDRQAVELALEKFKNLEAYTTKIRTLQSIIDGKDFILGLWDDIQAAVMSGSLEELEEAKISIPASGKALFENALIEAEKSIASHIEEETQEETAEESSFENWNASYVLESRSILNDISKIKSAADISALLERVEALRENFDDATFLFLNEPEAARKFEILDGSLKRLEIRVHELQHRIPVLRLDEAISQLNNYQDHPDFKRQAQRLIEELDEFYEAAKTHFHRTLDKELKKEYKKLHGLLEISADEFKVELEEKTTLWVTRIEAIPAVESFVDFIEDLDTSTVEYQDIATVLTELSQKETRFIAAAQAEFDQEDEDLFVLQQLYVDTYQRKASELKKKLEVVKNTPAEVQALEQVIVQITSELDRAEVDDTLPFDVEENLRLLNQKKSAFDPLYKEKVFEAEYQVKAKNLVSGYIKLEKRINNFSNKQEREATRQFLTIPEVATIVPLIEAIKKISREDIEPHARSTRRHTYNSEQLTVLFDDLQAAIDACNALGMFDEGNPFFNDKSEQIKKRALDLGDTSYQILDRLQGFITHSETPARKEDPNRMKVRAIVGELLTIIFGHDPRINSLKNEFLNKIGDVANTKLANFYRLQVGIQEVSVAGDPGKIDFGVYFDAIMPTLSDKYVSFLGMARALLLNPKTAEKGARVLTATERDSILMEESENLKVENEDMNKAEIDTHMIRVYDYILVRIKGKFATKDERERAGLYLPTTEEIDSKYDRTKPYDQWSKEEKKEFNEEFDYNHLSEDAVGDFIAHLKIEFDSLNEDKLREMVKYAQNMAVKSSGYVPWLLAGTTRAHGGTSALLGDKPFSDELFAAAPFAAGSYSRIRYAFVAANATAEDLLFMDEHTATSLIDHRQKRDGTRELWEVVESYRKAKWGEIPKWVTDVRRMTTAGTMGDGGRWDDDSLNVNENWLPMPGEVSVNIIRVEDAKRKFEEDNPNATEAQKAEFAKHFINMGYGKKYDDLGIKKLSQIDQGQYKLSFKATDKMFSTFREKPEWEHDKEVLIEDFRGWLSSVVGKAKLIPGKHQLLFAPMTMRKIYRLMNSFTASDDKWEVDELRREFVKELLGAGGVPKFVKEQVLLYLEWDQASIDKVFKYAEIAEPDEDNPENTEEYIDLESFKGLPDKRISSMIDKKRLLLEAAYKKKLYLFKTAASKRPGVKVARILPGGVGKKLDGAQVGVRAPWEYKHVDRDTTKGS